MTVVTTSGILFVDKHSAMAVSSTVSCLGCSAPSWVRKNNSAILTCCFARCPSNRNDFPRKIRLSPVPRPEVPRRAIHAKSIRIIGPYEEGIPECCRNFLITSSCIISVMNSNWSIFLSIDTVDPFLSVCCEDCHPADWGRSRCRGILPEGLAQTCYHVTGHFGLRRYDGSWDCTEGKFSQIMFGFTKAEVRTLDSRSPGGSDILRDLKFLRILPQRFAYH
ncbi:hypothetical protein EDD18DRAFT_1130744 [Armillaria luteobubalina]|uniref:Uncharacterized protein n=1 Tax=Armillaria luteobubalina TaxID=153913 RepID=A0AA39QIY6_9AGAR|nr:hypothetical protein EDD18DRAFT_1130744 [Armillaria luteobubalina]